MSKKISRPNEEIYAALQQAAEHFNAALFDGELPPAVITLQRGRNTLGYFSPDQWMNAQGGMASEIAINPAYFAHQSVLQMLQTVAHELCHHWQHTFGSPTRPGYHNREWADKMEEIGLIPSSTGAPGGGRVGQKMSDYPMPDGAFLMATAALVENGLRFEWVDRGFEVDQIFHRSPPDSCPLLSQQMLDILNTPVIAYFSGLQAIPAGRRVDKRKIKYVCQLCGTKVWGKPALAISCDNCDSSFVAEDQGQGK